MPDFYNPISSFYHLLYPDWNATIKLQASQLNSIFRELWGDRIQTVLDAACGIGTQSIGLAQLGYKVTASDISSGPLERAKKEADLRNVSISFQIADFRSLSAVHRSTFDVVIACDNAIPHLLTDEEIRQAFVEMRRCISPGGGFVISVRNYDPEESGTKVVPYGIRPEGKNKYLVFQVWEYQNRIYDLSMYFVKDSGASECVTHVMRSKYYAIPIKRLIELMNEAGFRDIRRFDDRFFQPLLTASG